MTNHEDPTRSFLDATVPAEQTWIDATLPRRVEPPAPKPGTWQRAMPLVSGLLFAAWGVEAVTDLG